VLERRKVLSLIFYILLGYLLGAVPFGRIIGFLVAGIDLTSRGSGNIGATNVGREIGTSWGLITLLLDAAKGFLPVLLLLENAPVSDWAVTLAILAPVVGHQFSVFSGFGGGKGVATSLGVWLAASPLAALMAVLPFALCTAIWRYVSLGSIAAALSLPLSIFIVGEGVPYILAGLITGLLIIFRHRQNIQRLLTGDEPRWRGGPHDRI
jgi:glycerol-3-phosphate acyltransferase PlsY